MAARALTPRQRQILRLVAAGHTNVQVGEQLQLAPDTVKKILASACQRLGAHDRAHAVFLSLRAGHITPEEVPDRLPPERPTRRGSLAPTPTS